MKIRIKGNSIRYRLTKSEVAAVCHVGYASDFVTFPQQLLTYNLIVQEQSQPLTVTFEDNVITLSLSKQLSLDWDTNQTVGFSHVLLLPNDKKLMLLVEKDFTCMDNTLEDQSDNYPNPKLKLK